MSVYMRGDAYWFGFTFAGKRHQASTLSGSKTLAKEAAKRYRRDLEEGYNGTTDRRKAHVQTIGELAKAYLQDYALRHRSVTFATYAVGHVTRHLSDNMVVEVSDKTVRTDQMTRRKKGASPKSINEEVGFPLRLMSDAGETLRAQLRKQKALKLRTEMSVAKAFSDDEKEKLLALAQESGARKSGSPMILPALALAFNTGMRDAEIRTLTWNQVDFEKRFLTVGKAKSAAGEGRTIPLNTALTKALVEHSKWYTERFGMVQGNWHLFPFGKSRHLDPTKAMTSLKTVWQNIKERAGITGRWHDARHTLITQLAESGAGDQTIMDIAGHVSRQMLSRYSDIRMEAKRDALESIGKKATKEKRRTPTRKRRTNQPVRPKRAPCRRTR